MAARAALPTDIADAPSAACVARGCAAATRSADDRANTDARSTTNLAVGHRQRRRNIRGGRQQIDATRGAQALPARRPGGGGLLPMCDKTHRSLYEGQSWQALPRACDHHEGHASATRTPARLVPRKESNRALSGGAKEAAAVLLGCHATGRCRHHERTALARRRRGRRPVPRRAPAVSWAADGFVKLLQMTVLPYVTSRSSPASASLTYARRARSACAPVPCWPACGRLALVFTFLIPLAFPDVETASFFSTTLHRARRRSTSSTSTSRPIRSIRSPTTSCRRWCCSRSSRRGAHRRRTQAGAARRAARRRRRRRRERPGSAVR